MNRVRTMVFSLFIRFFCLLCFATRIQAQTPSPSPSSSPSTSPQDPRSRQKQNREAGSGRIRCSRAGRSLPAG